MATYVEIILDEFREHLREENGWIISKGETGNEYAFDYQVRSNPNITIRVWSSIKKTNDTGRGCGEDAIRVCAFTNNRGLVKTMRVNRTTNWRLNLKDRIIEVIGLALKRF